MFEALEWTPILFGAIGSLLAAGLLAFFGWAAQRGGVGKPQRRAAHHLRRGEALIGQKQLMEAREELEQSIGILQSHPRVRLLAEAYLRHGDVDLELEEWDSAIQYFEQYKQLSAKGRWRIGEDLLYLRMGRANLGKGDVEEAFRCFDEAKRLQERIEQNPLLADTYSRLAEVQSRRNRVQEAIRLLLAAITIHERLKDRRREAESRVSLGKLYVAQAGHEEASSQYRKAAALFAGVGAVSLSELLLAEASKIDGD